MDFFSWPDGALGTALQWLITAIVVYVLVLWIALVAWTYRDIRQRSRDSVLQFVAVLLVLLFFLPGHWIYLILRPRSTLKEVYDRALEEEALLQELEEQHACASCRRKVQNDWLLCPSCGLQLKEPCETCERPLSYSWVVCPHCGTEKAPRPGAGIRPIRPRPGLGERPGPQRLERPRPSRALPGRGLEPSGARGAAATPERPPRRSPPRPGPAVGTSNEGSDFVIGGTIGEEPTASSADA